MLDELAALAVADRRLLGERGACQKRQRCDRYEGTHGVDYTSLPADAGCGKKTVNGA
jgi:hypothetical protein